MKKFWKGLAFFGFLYFFAVIIYIGAEHNDYFLRIVSTTKYIWTAIITLVTFLGLGYIIKEVFKKDLKLYLGILIVFLDITVTVLFINLENPPVEEKNIVKMNVVPDSIRVRIVLYNTQTKDTLINEYIGYYDTKLDKYIDSLNTTRELPEGKYRTVAFGGNDIRIETPEKLHDVKSSRDTIIHTVRILPPLGTVIIKDLPAGANLYIDDVEQGNALDSRYDLSIGVHEFKVTKEGFNGYTESIFIKSGIDTLPIPALNKLKFNVKIVPINRGQPFDDLAMDIYNAATNNWIGYTRGSLKLEGGMHDLIIRKIDTRKSIIPYYSRDTINVHSDSRFEFKLKKVDHGWLRLQVPQINNVVLYIDGKRIPGSEFANGRYSKREFFGIHTVIIKIDGTECYNDTVTVDDKKKLPFTINISKHCLESN